MDGIRAYGLRGRCWRKEGLWTGIPFFPAILYCLLELLWIEFIILNQAFQNCYKLAFNSLPLQSNLRMGGRLWVVLIVIYISIVWVAYKHWYMAVNRNPKARQKTAGKSLKQASL